MSLRIDQIDGLGNCLVSNQKFEPLDIVLQEEPILWMESNDYAKLLHSIVDYSVLDHFQQMPHSEFESNGALVLLRNRLVQSTPFQSDLIQKLLGVWSINSHDLGGGSGIFLRASKATHSCSPNVVLVLSGDYLQYIAIKSIREHEMITFAYITGQKLCWPRQLRQEYLERTRSFVCHCKRCDGVDDMRRFPCPCGGSLLLDFTQLSFQCTECLEFRDVTEYQLIHEQQMTQLVLEPSVPTIHGLEQLLDRDVLLLGHDHWITVLHKRMYVELCLHHERLNPTIKQVANQCLDWYYRVLGPINPVAAANCVFSFLYALDTTKEGVKDILNELLVWFELVWGRDDPDVLSWQMLLFSI
ncbi:hypothetical protein EDD86DRAFT_205488 [Gorgonomyces haynaldii]|nr:hypothetical protein EDD86DRAFT_205488 [Gorgonomyces haynaldii]